MPIFLYGRYLFFAALLILAVGVVSPQPAFSQVTQIRPFSNSVHDMAFLKFLRQKLAAKDAEIAALLQKLRGLAFVHVSRAFLSPARSPQTTLLAVLCVRAPALFM